MKEITAYIEELCNKITRLMASRDVLLQRLVELEKLNPGTQIDVITKSLAVLQGKE